MRAGGASHRPGRSAAHARPSGTGVSGCWSRPGTCGRACWISTGGGANAALRAVACVIRSCAGSWRRPGRARSGSWTPPGRGRCCAATATPGSPPPNAARPASVGPVPAAQRRLMPVRYYHGTFTLDGQRLRLPVSRGCRAVVGAAGPGGALPAGAGPVGHLADEGGRLFVEVTAEVPVATYPPGAEPGPGPGRRRGSGGHPPVRGRRPGRARAAGVGAGDPRRDPPAPHRHQTPPPGRGAAGRRNRGRRVAAVAEAPGPAAQTRGPAPAPGPAGPARGRQDRHRLGRAAPGRHAGGRRPARRAGPARPGGGTTCGSGTGGSATCSVPEGQGRTGRNRLRAGR